MNVEQYIGHDATALAQLVAAKQVTAAELLELAQSRAAEVNPKLNAIVTPMDEIAAKRAAEPLTGPFAGVPFLLKDIGQEFAGVRATYGSRALADNIPDEHAEVTKRWLDAGLVIFGRTNAPEFGAKGITESDLLGPARNPWNPWHTTGGSSGGSAAAVAAGIVPAAGASDGGGSIRIPAACNGLVGLKPSRGLTPFGAIYGEPLHGMALNGVLSRSVRDTAGLIDAVSGGEEFGEYVAREPAPNELARALDEPVGKLKIGYSSASAFASATPDAVAAVEDAAQLLTELGHEVEAVDPPYDDKQLSRDFLSIWFAYLAGSVAQVREQFGARSRDFEADTLAMAELGRAGGVIEPGMALARRVEYVRSLTEFHREYDFFLTPGLARAPLKIGEVATPKPVQLAARLLAAWHGGKLLKVASVMDRLIEENLGWVPYTQLANLTGRPAINVPLYWTEAGLPLGVQFVGRLDEDALLLRLAAQLESARPWFDRRPSL